MRHIRYRIPILLTVTIAIAALIQGCGGGGGTSFRSDVHGTVSDVDRNVILDADIWIGDKHTTSLTSGAFRLPDVPSGWQTIHARAMVNGVLWEGSTAVEVLEGEPTMNANIVLSPAGDTTYIEGYVNESVTGHRIPGARVLLTTRVLLPSGSSSEDGAYNSIVAITDDRGYYRMNDVPLGRTAVIAGSKVAFVNDEVELNPITDRMTVDFELTASDGTVTPSQPTLTGINAWTMPNQPVRSLSTQSLTGGNPYDAVRAFTSPRFREALKTRKTDGITTLAVTSGSASLIEIDLYWNALDVNLSRDLAGYGIYRRVGGGSTNALDFVRDPYANFYGDMGGEITAGVNYAYRVSAVDVEFLDRWNDFIPEAESGWSGEQAVIPLGAMHAVLPLNGASVGANPQFTWEDLSGASTYSVYVYDRFPTIPLAPGTVDPALYGTLPIWDSAWANVSSVTYAGPAFTPGHTYYWLVTASDAAGVAYSYSEMRSFIAR